MKKLMNLGIIVCILWAISYFILRPLSVTIVEPAYVTAIICCAIVFCAVVIPFVIKE